MSINTFNSSVPHPRRAGRGPLAWTALSLLLALVTLTACTSTQYFTHPLEEDYNNTYMYWTKESIIEHFGHPVSITTDANGCETLVYERYPEPNKHVDVSLDKQHLQFHLDQGSRCTQVETDYTEIISRRVKSKPTKKGIIWGSIGSGILIIEAVVLILTQ